MTAAGVRGMESIDADACRTLLMSEHIGRVAYVANDLPMIVPVDFVVFEDVIAFRTDPGDKLTHIPLQHVCFEADGSDSSGGVWSVIVRGFARDVTTALNSDYERLRRLDLRSTATLTNPRWIAVTIDEISGRRLTPTP